MKTVIRFLVIGLFAAACGLLIYAFCVIWPLNMLQSTGIIAAISTSLAVALISVIYLDAKSSPGP